MSRLAKFFGRISDGLGVEYPKPAAMSFGLGLKSLGLMPGTVLQPYVRELITVATVHLRTVDKIPGWANTPIEPVLGVLACIVAAYPPATLESFYRLGGTEVLSALAGRAVNQFKILHEQED